jgi:CheY-like chemotaxis protein
MQTNLESAQERRLRALLLDADEGALRAARRSLEHAGFEVLCARDGKAGLELLLGELLDLDVLVADLELPERDARSLARLIRGPGGERDLAFVVPVHAATPALRAELSALGVDAVVDRSEGPRAVAAAALAAVAARASSAADTDLARAAAPAEGASWVAAWLSSFERWSPIAA